MADQGEIEESDEARKAPALTLRDLLERYPIEGDFEEDMARQGWQDDAFAEFKAKMDRILSDAE